MESREKWIPPFISLVAPKLNLGKSELHQQGAFYIVDPSSVFAASLLSSVKSGASPNLLLDLCAAPGGKSIFAWRLLSPELLVANEVERPRFKALVSNFERCNITRSAAISYMPTRISAAFDDAADCVLVDAPCSGQSLLAKGEKALGCFHPATINRAAKRQRHIIAEAAKSVAPGGHLLYMTCTFAREENEEIIEWFLETFNEFVPVETDTHSGYRSRFTQIPCYRLWPQSGIGAGAFTALLRRDSAAKKRVPRLDEIKISWRR